MWTQILTELAPFLAAAVVVVAAARRTEANPAPWSAPVPDDCETAVTTAILYGMHI
ncbi:MAG: hypothetical protein JO128_23280 [Alphaproteobacteria bacterium]|nr:hypothetical protein [Alphaproteobacteria bacterium]